MLKTVLSLMLILSAPFGFAEEEDAPISLDEFLASTNSSKANLANDSIESLSIEQALARLSQFPEQKTVVIKDEVEGDAICEKYFEGIFYWGSCETDVAGKVYNASVLKLGVLMSQSNVFDQVHNVMKYAANRYFQDEALELFMSFTVVHHLPVLIAITADAQFDMGLAAMCNSRYSAIANLLTPVAAARRFNQGNILNCIMTIRNHANLTIKQKAQTKLCGLKPDIISRTACLQSVLAEK